MRRKANHRLMTEEEYLRFEDKAAFRNEYVDGHLFAMTGGTVAHNMICGNLFAPIHGRVRGSGCQATMNDIKVRIEEGRKYYYPDIMVSCESIEPKSVFKSNPVLLIEVLSPSTKQIDRREKLVAYQSIPSLQEYVMVHQDRQQAEVYRRVSEIEWQVIVVNEGKELVLESLPNGPLKIPFDIIYEGYNPPLRVKDSESEYAVDR